MKCWVVFATTIASWSLTYAAEPVTYRGSVGKLEAEYSIRWNEDGTVTGTYFYPSRSGTVYQLDGHNHEQGKLYLEEYTGGTLSARCHLSKRLTNGDIVWEGEMHNTDGRVLPMNMARARDVPTNMPERPTDNSVVPSLYSKIPANTTWPEPPKANVAVDRATMWYEGAEFVPAAVRGFTTGDGSSNFSLEFGVYREGVNVTVVEYTGPTVSLSIPRGLPFQPNDLIGETVFLEIAADGSILSISIAELAVTHYRMHSSGKFEIRAVVVPDEIFAIEAHLVAKDTLNNAKRVEFVPDKVALPHRLPPGEQQYLMMQTLRITAEFGIALQVTEAGPGALELESLALDPPSEGAPWIPVGTEDGRSKTPPTQRTQEAG